MARNLDTLNLSQDLSVSVGDVCVGYNEYVSRFSLNRNYRKLIANDLDLLTLYNRVSGGEDIEEWSPNVAYEPGKLVWFTEGAELYLLRNQVIGNTTKPNPQDFVESGWKNENEHKTILDYGLETTIQRYARKMINDHQNGDLHSLGSLSGQAQFDRKLLRKDFTNRITSRDTNFYPYQTMDMLDADPSLSDVVLDGSYRVYDNGMLEYDVLYRMGYMGQEDIDGDLYDVISCNCVDFRDTSRLATKDPQRNENGKYFFNTGDFSIFRYENTSKNNFSIIGTTVQRNRNDYCNVYHAKIRFPHEFSDLKYCVFGSQVTCEDKGDSGIPVVKPSDNHLVYCDKTIGSITALLITRPGANYGIAGYNATHGGLYSNTFHLKAIGWRR